MSQGCIYVVDDDEAVRDALSMLFMASGLTVRAFSNAATFLASDHNEKRACLVLDVRMPGIGGLQLQDELVKRV